MTSELDTDKDLPKSVNVEIEISSIWTDNRKLTDHLQSPDFFDAKNYPTATFKSRRVEPAKGSSEECRIIGDFTMLGVTHEVEMTAITLIDPEGFQMWSEILLDRTKWGMTYGENIRKLVKVDIAIGVSRSGLDEDIRELLVWFHDQDANGNRTVVTHDTS